MEPVIYLDMDGVGSDWSKRAVSALGVSKDQLIKIPNYHEAMRDMYAKDPNFFYKLELYPPYIELIAKLRKLGVKFRILTALCTDHWDIQLVRTNKLHWLSKYTDVQYPEVCFARGSSEKVKWAHKGAILIDDFHRNCTQFEAAGGHAVQVDDCNYNPDDVVDKVKAILAAIA